MSHAKTQIRWRIMVLRQWIAWRLVYGAVCTCLGWLGNRVTQGTWCMFQGFFSLILDATEAELPTLCGRFRDPASCDLPG